MSFILHPGVLTTEELPPYYDVISGWSDKMSAGYIGKRFFIGTGKDEGLFLFMRNSKWTIAADIMPDIRIVPKNITLKPNCRKRYGFRTGMSCIWEYVSGSTSWYLFRSGTGWVLRSSAPSSEPVIPPDSNFYSMKQDYWTGSSGNIPEEDDVFHNANDYSKTMTLRPSFPRWEFQGTSEPYILPAGTFQPVDGARGIRTVGTPVKNESGAITGYVITEKKKTVYMGEAAICR